MSRNHGPIILEIKKLPLCYILILSREQVHASESIYSIGTQRNVLSQFANPMTLELRELSFCFVLSKEKQEPF